MQVERKHFPSILSDNEENYFQYLCGVLEAVDELAILQITKVRDGFIFRISPSVPKYNNLLIEEILKIHNVFNIRLDLSKSIKSSGVLTYRINL